MISGELGGKEKNMAAGMYVYPAHRAIPVGETGAMQ
jgi:hypothetical protein